MRIEAGIPAFLESGSKSGQCPAAQPLTIWTVSMLRMVHDPSGQHRGSGMASTAQAQASWEKTIRLEYVLAGHMQNGILKVVQFRQSWSHATGQNHPGQPSFLYCELLLRAVVSRVSSWTQTVREVEAKGPPCALISPWGLFELIFAAAVKGKIQSETDTAWQTTTATVKV